MSLTPLIWLLLYCGAALRSFADPVYGMLAYLLEYYMRPELNWWGKELPALRWNLIISIVFGASFLLRRSHLREMRSTPNLALPWLFGLMIVMVVVTFTTAVSPPTSWNWAVQWTKMALIFPLLAAAVIRTRADFNAFVVFNILGSFWWGYQAWLNPRRTQGRLRDIGSGDTQHDNAAAAHLLTVIPFIVVYFLTEKNKKLRLLALVAAPFVINTVILCNSRGATLAMLTALTASVFLIRRGYRMRLAGVGIAVAAAFFLLADRQFFTRQQTTAEHSDSSSVQRLYSWSGGLDLVKDNPLGTGGRGFHLLSPVYIPLVVQHHGGQYRAPHNTYLMVAAEWGILGFIMYMGFYGATFLMLHRVKKCAEGTDFFYWRAFALQLGLIAFMVAAIFIDRLYAEIPYWLSALSYSLYRVQATEQATEAVAGALQDGTGAAAPAAVPGYGAAAPA